MKKKKTNQSGFTLVEIMMVVIIIGILAVLGIPRYQIYLLESKLSEVQVAIGEIKQGESKFYNSHNPIRYRAVNGIDELQRVLRVDLGGGTNFDYDIVTYGNVNDNNIGYVIRAHLTAQGADEIGNGAADIGRSIWFIYPKEYAPREAEGDLVEEWEKGWNDEEFFNDALAPGDNQIGAVDIPAGYTDPVGNYVVTAWP